MGSEPTTASAASPPLPAAQVYGMAILCLVAGLTIGYLFRGSPSPVSPAQPAASARPAPLPAAAMSAREMPSPEAMKRMADKQAAPILEKLKSDPNNAALLVQAGAIYHTTRQFKEAADYYGRAVRVDPRNVAFRTKLASSLYRGGDVDGAITELNQALSYAPNDADALFDLGMIRLQGKRDGKGALAAWQRLLKSNPQLSEERKAMVLKLMAGVMTTLGDQHGTEGAGSHDRR